MHNLRLRYGADIIYTYSGLFLVALNPYKNIPIYTEELIEIYKGRRRDEMSPHVYSSTDVTYRAMLETQRSQSMLITGESGAGKTENTKKVIQYLAAIAGRSNHGNLEKQLLLCNPLLESLGNAKTLKNNNSSRFGKFIKITFDKSGLISGASIVSYLLEKSRVVFQNNMERSFHIFYQITKGFSDEERKKYHVGPPESYRFLSSSGCTTAEGINDQEDLKSTLEAMKILKFSPAEQETLFSVVSAVLNLGNVEFEPAQGDTSSIKKREYLEYAANLLKVDAKVLEDALLRPRIKAGKELIAKSLSPEQASNSRDALCKALYGRMFLWVVQKINESLQVKTGHHFIGILDIAGFEIFKNNSFEQLCINYTNEKLQQFFNNHMFKLEQEEYQREKLDWKMMNFGIDSQATIDLIERKPRGILIMLDEESLFPKATDSTFVAKLVAGHDGKQPKFRKAKLGNSDLSFSVAHYAGEVEYDATKWLEKNKDPLQNDLESCIRESQNICVATFITAYSLNSNTGDEENAQNKGSSRRKGAAFITVASQYKEQLEELMDTLQSTNPHFIRCILPNRAQKPGKIEVPVVLDQLRCNGVLEGIRIARKGFPNRMIYPEFLKRYYILEPGIPRKASDPKGAVISLINCLETKGVITDPDNYRVGLTKIFFRAGVLGKIEEAREKRISEYVPLLQAAARGLVSRRHYAKLNERKNSIVVLQRNIRAWLEFRSWAWFKLFQKARPLLVRRDLEREMADKEEHIKKFRTELDSKLNGNNQVEEEVNHLRSEQDEVKQKIKKLQNEKEELENNYRSLTDAKLQLEKKLNELNESMTNLDNTLDENDHFKKEITNKLMQTLKEIERVSKQNEQMAAEEKKKVSELEYTKKDIEESESSIEKLKKKIEELDNELANMESNMENEIKSKSSLMNVKSKLVADLDEIESELTNVKAKNAELEKKIQKFVEDSQDLAKQMAEETQAREKADAVVKKLTIDFENVNQMLEKESKTRVALEKAKKQLEDDLENFEKDLSNDNKQLSENLKKNKKLDEEISYLQGQLEHEEDNFQKSKRDLTSYLEDLENQIRDSQNQIEKLKREKSDIEVELNQYNQDISNERKRGAELMKDKKQLQNKIEDGNEQLQEAQKKASNLEKARAKFESDFKAILRNIEGQKSKNKNIENDIKSLQLELSQINDAYATGNKMSDTLNKSIKEKNRLLDDYAQQLEELTIQKNSIDSNIKNISQDIRGLNENFEDLEDKKKSNEAKINQLEKDCSEKSHALQTLQMDNRNAGDQISAMENALNDYLSNLDNIKSKCESLAREHKKYQNESSELGSKVDETQKILEKSVKTVRKLELDLKEARKEQQLTRQLNNDSENNYKKLDEQLNKLQKRSQSLEGQVASMDRNIKQLKSQVNEAEESDDLLNKSVSDLEKLIKELNVDIKNAADLAENSENLKVLLAQIQSTRNTLDDSIMQLNLLENSISRLEEENRKTSSRIEEAKQELDGFKEDLDKQTKDFKKSRNELSNVENLLKDENKKNSDLERQLNNIVKQTKKLESESASNSSRLSLNTKSDLEKAKSDLQSLQSELNNERNNATMQDNKIKSLSSQISEIKEQIEEIESSRDLSIRKNRAMEDELHNLREQLEDLEEFHSNLVSGITQRNLEKSDLNHQYEIEAQARSKFEALCVELEKELQQTNSTLEKETSLFDENNRSVKKVELEINDLKSRYLQDINEMRKENKRLEREIQLIRERISQYEIQRDEQRALAWKYQEEAENLHSKLNQEHQLRTQEAQAIQAQRARLVQLGDINEDIVRESARNDKQSRALQLEHTNLKEESSKLISVIQTLQYSQQQAQQQLLEAKRALDREISNREALEDAKRTLEVRLAEIYDSVEQERSNRTKIERESQNALSDAIRAKEEYSQLTNQLAQLEKSKQRTCSDLKATQLKLSEIQMSSSRYAVSNSRLESDLRRLKEQLKEISDRSSKTESQALAAKSQAEKYKANLNDLNSHLNRVRNEFNLTEKKRAELEEKTVQFVKLFVH